MQDSSLRLVVPDLRGCGLSSIPEGKGAYSWKNQLEDLKALLSSPEVQTGETKSLNANAKSTKQGEDEDASAVTTAEGKQGHEETKGKGESKSVSLYPKASSATASAPNRSKSIRRVWLVGAREGGFWCWMAAADPSVAAYIKGIVVVNSPHPVWLVGQPTPNRRAVSKQRELLTQRLCSFYRQRRSTQQQMGATRFVLLGCPQSTQSFD